MSFFDFLTSVKKLSKDGISSRISRLNWVENACQQSADHLSKDENTMYDSRAIIYQQAKNLRMAGNYYNSLKLYYEYIHGKECPRVKK